MQSLCSPHNGFGKQEGGIIWCNFHSRGQFSLTNQYQSTWRRQEMKFLLLQPNAHVTGGRGACRTCTITVESNPVDVLCITKKYFLIDSVIYYWRLPFYIQIRLHYYSTYWCILTILPQQWLIINKSVAIWWVIPSKYFNPFWIEYSHKSVRRWIWRYEYWA